MAHALWIGFTTVAWIGEIRRDLMFIVLGMVAGAMVVLVAFLLAR